MELTSSWKKNGPQHGHQYKMGQKYLQGLQRQECRQGSCLGHQSCGENENVEQKWLVLQHQHDELSKCKAGTITL